ncbi:MAG: T9SS type A sorting domain-containing protein [Bacteroidales bacterium]|nr:T9SS type A sorting domain-containing protein [Bacteroidales bacterium]
MKKLFTLLFIVSGVIVFAQTTQIPVLNKVKTMEGNIRRDLPELGPNDYKNDIINETFETWPPTDWQIINGSESVGNQQWHQSGTTNMYASVEYDNGDGVVRNQDEWMITPLVTIPENAFLTFAFHSNPYWMVDPNNNADVKVLVSTDATNWTEIWNEDEYVWEYDVWTDVYLNLSDYETQSIYIAFQYEGSDACWFYIDDVRVYSLPEFDIEISKANINFFEIFDYHEEPDYYYYSSHYSKIPFELLDGNEDAYLVFNAEVINKGFGTGTVQCNVVINDPNGDEVYNQTSYNETEIGEMQVDTVDVGYADGTEFVLNNPVKGVYEVIYTIFVGEPGVNPINIFKDKEVLTKTLNFEITDKEYSRADNINDEFIGPKYWEGGDTDGDILTVKYLFFEDVTVDTVKAFIHEDTDPGTALICNIWQYDEGTSGYTIKASSSLVTIEQEDIGTWKSFVFNDPALIVADLNYTATSALIGFEFYFNGEDNNLWLGCDKTSPSSPWGTLWYLNSGQNANTWTAITNFVGVPMIKAVLHDDSGDVNQTLFENSINIYPNPATDFVRISGVENCQIEIYNNIGAKLTRFVAQSDMCNIDMSDYPAGLYYVMVSSVSGENRTAVKKISKI